MTDQQHPITPPTELVQQWAAKHWGDPGYVISSGEKYIATQAAAWGADQELEACCECLTDWDWDEGWSDKLHAARRPKPPSLKELAKLALSELNLTADPDGAELSRTQIELIRNTLEAFLND